MSLEDTYFGFYDNCVAGYWCLRRAGSEDYRCEKLCTESDRSACGSAYPDEGGDLTVDGLCIYSLGPEMPVVGLMACAVAAGCSPTCQDCPGGGPGGTVGCYPATDSINIGTICASFTRDDEAPGFTGDVCTSLNHCSPGYTCLAATGGGRECRPFCDPNATYPAGDGDADADADAGDADADADADADSDAGPICPFVFCEDRVGEGAGTSQSRPGLRPRCSAPGSGSAPASSSRGEDRSRHGWPSRGGWSSSRSGPIIEPLFREECNTYDRTAWRLIRVSLYPYLVPAAAGKPPR